MKVCLSLAPFLRYACPHCTRDVSRRYYILAPGMALSTGNRNKRHYHNYQKAHNETAGALTRVQANCSGSCSLRARQPGLHPTQHLTVSPTLLPGKEFALARRHGRSSPHVYANPSWLLQHNFRNHGWIYFIEIQYLPMELPRKALNNKSMTPKHRTNPSRSFND